MAMIALVSAASDGVTTAATALALSSRQSVLLAEFDMSGSKLRHRLLRDIRLGGQILNGNIGLHKLAEAYWSSAAAGVQDLAPQVDSHLWPMDDSGRRLVLPGLTDPRQAASLTEVWPSLIEVLQMTDHTHQWDVIVDGGRLVWENGRLHPVLTPSPVLHQADVVLLVVRLADPASVYLASAAIEGLQDELGQHGNGARALGLLTLSSGSRREFSPREVEAKFEAEIMGSLAWDERAAAYLSAGGVPPRNLARSSLLRSARDVVGPLRAYAQRRRTNLDMRARSMSPAVLTQVRQLGMRRRGEGE
ncbi:hypothetical protein [Streptomyces sp. NPDC047803]|uniref:MinD/ParA family ATP-binding protein n=1 Tax=unclassified Streptomyces TaxID=2593676 RepID=UPI0033DA30D8